MSRALFSRPHLLLALALVVVLGPRAVVRGITVEQVTTNGRARPLGISADDLSFSWSTQADARGVAQSAYQIRVGAAEGGAEIWDSGWVVSDRQIDIILTADRHLKPATRYY